MPSNSRFASIARWCFKHPGRVVLLWIVVLIGVQFAAGAAGLKEASNFRLSGTESQQAFDVIEDRFPAQKGEVDQVVFATAGSAKVTDPAVEAKAEKAFAAIAAQDQIASVVSPYEPEGEGQISKDGKVAFAQVTYKTTFDELEVEYAEAVQEEAFKLRGDGVRVEVGGIGAQLARQEEPGATEGIGILAALVVLLITFGSVVAAGLPLLTALLSLGTALGLVTLGSHLVDTPDFGLQVATLIGLGVGIDYSLFVLTRYRAEVRGGSSREEAVVTALDTAGRTVFFAAITVVIAVMGMLTLGLSFLNGVATGAAAAVICTAAAALTLLPALLRFAGGWIDRLRLPSPGRKKREAADAARGGSIEGRGWDRWSAWVQKRPWPAALAAMAILLALTAPALGMNLGSSDAGNDPKDSTTRKAYELVTSGFGPGVNGQFLFVTELPRPGDDAAADQLVTELRGEEGIVSVLPPTLSPDRTVATVVAYPTTAPQDDKTVDLLERLRSDVSPRVERETGAKISIGGFTPAQEDFTEVVSRKLPIFIGIVVLLSALLLMAVFRSVLIPIKAAVLNLLSIGAALGLITLIFQEGFLADQLGVGSGPIESFMPVMMFAIVFGLSMDYEVFLLSRVREEWSKSKDSHRAVRVGLATTGRVITAAAAIMIVVFSSFALGDDRIIKMFGIGFASAVFIDAVVIRCLLVPAIMEIMGRRAWWLPERLDRILPDLHIEREPRPSEAGD